jgi:FtsZ-binding cell division protein ZapB
MTESGCRKELPNEDAAMAQSTSAWQSRLVALKMRCEPVLRHGN